MKPALRWAILVVVASASLFAAMRIFGLMKADEALQHDDAGTALGWRADDPAALVLQAEAQLERKDPQAAATARRALQLSPTEGRGYRVLAQVALAEGHVDKARSLFEIAARRAPRDPPAHAWLAQDALQRGEFARALEHIDAVLTMSPGSRRATLPVLVKLAEDPGFAAALAKALTAQPTWRGQLLQALAAPETGNPVANDLVLAALARNGGLAPAETAAWLDSLMRQGRWGEAYAWWAGPMAQRGIRLPLLFNGDFSRDPSGVGFDWKLANVPGLIVDFEDAAGVDGRAAHLRFLGRRVSGTFLSHPLLLAPGRYRLDWRERSQAMRADVGPEWRISCAGAAGALASSEPLVGAYPWRTRRLQFEILANDCAGQWLEFAPAGQPGAGDIMSGELWIADMILTRD